MANFIEPKDVQWRRVQIIKDNLKASPEHTFYHHEFDLPAPLCDWDVFDYWERERFESMRDNLKQGDVLFDIGTEQGWCNLIYAKFTGPENIVLIEPTPEFWPNIVQIWEKNYPGVRPKALYDGLLSDKTTDKRDLKKLDLWGDNIDKPQIDRNSYKYIHEHGDVVPQMTIDDYVKKTGIVPDALTMDTEGAEILILEGAVETLRKHKPIVWASIHPDLAVSAGYGDVENVHKLMRDLGYQEKYLATDHEEHWVFWHPDRGEIV